jgi:hypothetical protein
VEEIPTGEVLAVTFFLNEHPVIILLDSGASHDFMSSTCAKKAKLSLVPSGASYVIGTPGGHLDADWIVQKVLLELSGRIFSTNLIILNGQGIDVILHLPAVSRIKVSLHHVIELKLKDIHVVREFLDVFPDDLPGMPPERAIKFKIEL